MTSKTYSALIDRVQGQAGVNFTPSELVRLNALANKRARMALNASLYWPRWLVVSEERTITDRLVPWAEVSKDTIGDFIRIHRKPFLNKNSVVEFNFYTETDGARVVGFIGDQTSVYVTYQKQFDVEYGNGEGQESDIPTEWFEYMAYGLYVDYLRMDEQVDKAIAEERFADQLLALELTKAQKMQSAQGLLGKITTHTSSQGRTY